MLNMSINSAMNNIAILDDEVSVINGLQQNGIIFLEDLANDEINSITGSKIYDYYNIYVNELFSEEGKNEYVNFVISGYYNLWRNVIVKYSGRDIILMHLNNISNGVYNMNFYERIDIIKEIIKPLEVQNALACDNLFKYKNGCSIENNSFLGMIIKNIKMDSNWTKNIKKIHGLFLILIKNTNLREYVMKWFANVFNLNIEKIHLDIDNKIYLSSDIFMSNVLGLLLYFWNNGVYDKKIFLKEKLKLINIKFITSKQCYIKWYDINNEDNENYNFLTIVFFLILNGIRVVYIPTLRRILNSEDTLQELESEKMHMEGNKNMLSTLAIIVIKKQIYSIKKYLSFNIQIKDNKLLFKSVDMFLNNWLIWYNEYKTEELNIDDILNVLIFFENTCKKEHYKINNTLLTFGLDIISSEKHTKNPVIRTDCLEFIKNVYIHNKSNFDIKILIKSIVKFIVGIDRFRKKDNIQTFFSKNLGLKFILSIFENNTLHGEYINKIFSDISKKNDYNIKFINIIINDALWIDGTLDSLFKKLINCGDNLKNDTDSIYEILKSQFFIISSIFLLKRMDIYAITICKDEIISKLALVLNSSIRWLINLLDPKIFEPIKFPQINAYVHYVISMYHDFMDNKMFIKCTINDVNDFDIDQFVILFDRVKDILSQEERTTTENIIQEITEYYISNIESIIIEEEEEQSTIYPDELLDPFTCTIISNPVMIPGGDDIFLEKDTIENYLLNDEVNPYTNLQFTVDDLIKYNEKDTIKQKIEDFKECLNEWKTKNKK